jgi:hypothetical protein
MQQGPHAIEVTFIPTIWVPHFIVEEEGQDGGQCQFLCKNIAPTLTMICNINCESIVFASFQGSNFNFYDILALEFACVLYMYRYDVHHLMN